MPKQPRTCWGFWPPQELLRTSHLGDADGSPCSLLPALQGLISGFLMAPACCASTKCHCPVFPSCPPGSKGEGTLPSLGNEGSSSVSIGKRVTSGHFSPKQLISAAKGWGWRQLGSLPWSHAGFGGSREGDRAVSWPTAHSHSGCCTQTQVGKACDQNGAKGSLKIKKQTRSAVGAEKRVRSLSTGRNEGQEWKGKAPAFVLGTRESPPPTRAMDCHN